MSDLSLSELNKLDHGEPEIKLAPPVKERPRCLYCGKPLRPDYDTKTERRPVEFKWVLDDDPRIVEDISPNGVLIGYKMPGGWQDSALIREAPPSPPDDKGPYTLFTRQRERVTKRVWTGRYRCYRGTHFCSITHAADWAASMWANAQRKRR